MVVETPTWERRLVRELEMIRSRNGKYWGLPLDVSGEGWAHLVSANFRSQTVNRTSTPPSRSAPAPNTSEAGSQTEIRP